MSSPTDPYSAHSETIESVLAYIRRVHRLTPDVGDEFSSWARLRLIENNILGKFQGRSTIGTFLIAVLQNLFKDWRNAQWGRWRPSSRARGLGPVAIELERLVLRDGRDYDETVQTLVSTGVAVSPSECDEVWGQLPRRARRQRADVAVLESLPDPEAQTDWLGFDELEATATRTRQALAQALRSLAPQEQIIIRLRYLDKFTVPRMAAVIGGEGKPIYRLIEQIQAKLAASLAASGITAEEVLDLFGNPEVDLGDVLAAELGKLKVGPSTSLNAGGGA